MKETFAGEWVDKPLGESQSPVNQPSGSVLPAKSSRHSKVNWPPS
jgi:hypothetical protein